MLQRSPRFWTSRFARACPKTSVLLTSLLAGLPSLPLLEEAFLSSVKDLRVIVYDAGRVVFLYYRFPNLPVEQRALLVLRAIEAEFVAHLIEGHVVIVSSTGSCLKS